MTTRVAGGGRTGISPVTLIVFIIVALIAGMIDFMMYTRTVTREAALADVTVKRQELDRAIQQTVAETAEIRNYLEGGKRDAEAVRQYFADLDMRGLVVKPRDFHKVNMDLDLWILRLDKVKRELDKRINEATGQAEGAETARDFTREDYNRHVQEKNQEFARLGRRLRDELAKKEDLVAQSAKEKQGFIDQYNKERDKWEERKRALLVQADRMTRKNQVDRRDLKVLRPEPSIQPPSGKILRSDWRIRKAVISLGKDDHVFPGLVFEVYTIDSKGVRVVKGKVEVKEVLGESSIASVIESDPENPVVAGDAIQTLFLPIPRKQKFVIAGFIPPDAIYDRNQIEALIQLNGGELQKVVNLYTDMLILGETVSSGLVDMDKKPVGEAQSEYQRGLTEAEFAREISVDIIDYREFLQSIRR